MPGVKKRPFGFQDQSIIMCALTSIIYDVSYMRIQFFLRSIRGWLKKTFSIPHVELFNFYLLRGGGDI